MPPRIVKQVAKPATRKATTYETVVDRIKPVSIGERGLKINIYGRGKTGKTRLVCSFPKPLLLISPPDEDGTLSVTGIKGVDFVQIQATAEIDELVAMLKGGKYRTVALDHAGGLQDLALKEILGLDQMPIQQSWGLATRENWMTCTVQVKERLRYLLMLADTHNINVPIIAHEKNFGDEQGTEILFPTVGSALQPATAGWLNGACDYICQTYIREQTVAKKTGNITVDSKTGLKEYCLRVGPHPVYMTGFRLKPGTLLPDSIINPTYDKVIKLINGEPVK